MSDVRTILQRGIGGATPPPDGFERMLRRRDRKRRNQRITAGAVGIAIFVAAVWIVTTGGPLDRSQPASTGPTIPPASERVGFIGLPPEGATPSAPQGGELVLSIGGRSTTDDGLFLVWVYADGRLIWEKEGDFPYGANEVTTGLLEQRLTPDGVERMRSEIVSTGLFADDLNLLSTRGVIWGTIRVRHGDRLVRVDWSNPDIYPRDHGTVATLEQSSTLVRLDALLTHPISWLPTSAWEDQEIGAYVPSRFAVCYEAAERGIDPSRILSVLPASAEELLRAKNRSQNDPNDNCTEVTVEEARALAEAFNDAGLEQEERSSSSRLGFVFDPPVPLAPGPIENAVSIYFEPYLPHGLFQSCSPCG